jgi:hypothetical protein
MTWELYGGKFIHYVIGLSVTRGSGGDFAASNEVVAPVGRYIARDSPTHFLKDFGIVR